MNKKSIEKFSIYIFLGTTFIVLISWLSIALFDTNTFAPIALVFLVLSISFWFWIFIDCAIYEPMDRSSKIIWLLIIALTHGIGALVYYFIRRPQRIKELEK